MFGSQKHLKDVIKSRAQIVANTRQIFLHPITLCLYPCLVIYYYLFRAGELYGEGYTLYRTVIAFGSGIAEYAVAYFLLGYWLHAGLMRNIPLIALLLSFFMMIFITELTLGHLFFHVGVVTFSDMFIHFVSVSFLAAFGSVMALGLFSDRMKNFMCLYPDYFPLWWPVKNPTTALVMELPKDIRGQIIRLHSENQYVNVVTEKGAHLIRSTLAEAISKLNEKEGLRVHRSLWIRKDQITKIQYEKGNPKILDIHDQSFPISRNKISEIKAACFPNGF